MYRTDSKSFAQQHLLSAQTLELEPGPDHSIQLHIQTASFNLFQMKHNQSLPYICTRHDTYRNQSKSRRNRCQTTYRVSTPSAQHGRNSQPARELRRDKRIKVPDRITESDIHSAAAAASHPFTARELVELKYARWLSHPAGRRKSAIGVDVSYRLKI
ncbi:hypothetical protein BDQ17DRAFT_506737 [Cyathus striatus]|nr:hypothetical protein BDQ17DRAFT_506737 [Cyathus striatus]